MPVANQLISQLQWEGFIDKKSKHAIGFTAVKNDAIKAKVKELFPLDSQIELDKCNEKQDVYEPNDQDEFKMKRTLSNASTGNSDRPSSPMCGVESNSPKQVKKKRKVSVVKKIIPV